MRIAISSTGKTINDEISEVFGRCPYFLIVENKKIIEIIKNESVNQRGGAGISASKLMAEKKIDIVISNNVGPRALDVLEQFKIKIVLKKGTVEKAIEEIKD
jgi:predicted Fe-Mo cluster-binding NifX family protein